MSNASDPMALVPHFPWCDRAEHALYASDCEGSDMAPHCLSSYIEAGEVGAWILPGKRGPVVAMDSFLTDVRLDAYGLRTMLAFLSSPEKVQDVRTVLSRALEVIEGSTEVDRGQE